MQANKTEIAYQAIKSKIMTNALPPLCDIVEDDLQKGINVSRTPIREALQRLSKEGFVYIYPRKGTIVSEVSMELLRELYEVRALLEPIVARLSCENGVEENWLYSIRDRLVNPPEGLEPAAARLYYIQLDNELHATLLGCCGNRFLVRSMENVYDHNERIRMKVSNPRSQYDQSVSEHIEIINALLARDPDAVEAATRHHIEESRKISFKFYPM